MCAVGPVEFSRKLSSHWSFQLKPAIRASSLALHNQHLHIRAPGFRPIRQSLQTSAHYQSQSLCFEARRTVRCHLFSRAPCGTGISEVLHPPLNLFLFLSFLHHLSTFVLWIPYFRSLLLLGHFEVFVSSEGNENHMHSCRYLWLPRNRFMWHSGNAWQQKSSFFMCV